MTTAPTEFLDLLRRARDGDEDAGGTRRASPDWQAALVSVSAGAGEVPTQPGRAATSPMAPSNTVGAALAHSRVA